MKHPILLLGIALCVSLMSGCTLMAPNYTASIENVQRLKEGGNFSATVGKFESVPDRGNANQISLRGSSLVSPYANSFAAYLAEAVKQELSLAGKLVPGTDVEVSGMLLKNDIDASGFSIATGIIQATLRGQEGGCRPL